MEFHTLLLFAVASLSINLIPGPDVIYIVSNTMTGKMRQGIKAALGLGVGYFFHTFAAVVGLSALVLNSAIAFTAVKWLGALYLFYLGISSILAMWKGKSNLNKVDDNTVQKNVFVQGVVVSVLNPKVALFFLSFLPQFIDVSAGETHLQLLTLGVLFSALATCCNLVYAAAGSWLLSRPRAAQYSRGIEGVAGVLLIGLAGKIVLNDK